MCSYAAKTGLAHRYCIDQVRTLALLRRCSASAEMCSVPWNGFNGMSDRTMQQGHKP